MPYRGGVGVKKLGRASCILWLVGLLVFAASSGIANDIDVSDPFADRVDQTLDDAYRAPAPVIVVEREAERQPVEPHVIDAIHATPRASVLSPRQLDTALLLPAISVIVLCSFRN
jgi:hypothetical protein